MLTWLIWWPVGWLVGGCGAAWAVSRKTSIYFIYLYIQGKRRYTRNRRVGETADMRELGETIKKTKHLSLTESFL